MVTRVGDARVILVEDAATGNRRTFTPVDGVTLTQGEPIRGRRQVTLIFEVEEPRCPATFTFVEVEYRCLYAPGHAAPHKGSVEGAQVRW
jgi:hypothetical protein